MVVVVGLLLLLLLFDGGSFGRDATATDEDGTPTPVRALSAANLAWIDACSAAALAFGSVAVEGCGGGATTLPLPLFSGGTEEKRLFLLVVSSSTSSFVLLLLPSIGPPPSSPHLLLRRGGLGGGGGGGFAACMIYRQIPNNLL